MNCFAFRSYLRPIGESHKFSIYPSLLVFSLFLIIAPVHSSAESIDRLESIELGGLEQWILMQGADTTNPILLFLHGGPGYASLPLLHQFNPQLENYFTVVNWDQRGAGKSYSPDIPEDTMTLEQFVSDAHELTNYLKTEFEQQKIYIVGHSFGTVIGILLAQHYPEDYIAFIGVGQVVDVIENEQLSYDFALSQAIADNNDEAIDELTFVGRPTNDFQYQDDSGFDITIKWVGYYGGDLFGETSTDSIEEFILNSAIYENDTDNIIEGWSFSGNLFNDNELVNLDFRKSAAHLQIPVYFLAGHHDYDTPFELVQYYYDVLSAPIKELIWFESSAHFPFIEESNRFNEILINKVLKETFESNIDWALQLN